jgi:hypothetical protein
MGFRAQLDNEKVVRAKQSIRPDNARRRNRLQVFQRGCERVWQRVESKRVSASTPEAGA